MRFTKQVRRLLLTLTLAFTALGQAMAQPFAYVANTLSDNVSVINLATNAVATTITVGDVPVDIAPSPDGTKLAVVNATSGTISLVDVATNTVTSTFAVSGIPSDALYSPDGTKLYVSFLSLNEVRVYNVPAGTLATTISFAGGPTDMALRPGTNLIYVVRSSFGELGVIDLTTNTVTGTTIVLEGLLGSNSSNPFAIRITPDGSKAVVPNSSAFYSNVVNLGTNAVSRVQQFGFDAFMNGSIEVAISADGGTALITQEAGGVLSVIDLSTNEIVNDIFFSPTDQPIGVAISADGTTAYVALTAADQVAVVDLAAGTYTTLNVGDAPRDVLIPPVAVACPPAPETTLVAATIVQGGSFLFDGVLRTAAGVYTSAVYPNSDGCDSLAQLTLTVVPGTPSGTVSNLQTILNQNQLASGGLSASVLSNGSIATVFNGFADVGTPTTASIKFGLSDISQHLMAVLTLRLVEEGIITLSTTLGSPIAGLNPSLYPPTRTIEQLLRHTTGINNFAANANYKNPGLSLLFNNLSQDWEANTPSYLPILNSYVNTQGAPGAAGTFRYSLTNYLLLGERLEQLTGQSLQSLLNTYVLAPAGISPIQFWDVPNPTSSSTYYFNLSGLGTEALSDQTSVLTSSGASGSIVATPAVIALYMRALFSGQILSQTSLNQLQSFTAITGRPSNAYGIGTERFSLNIGGTNYDFVGHVGDVNYSTALIYSPVLNAGAFVSCNNDDVSQATVLEIARQLIQAATAPPCPAVPVTTPIAASVCPSELPFVFNGQNLTAGGVYNDTLTTAAGCDSIIVLTLTVKPAFNTTASATVCADELPFTFGTQSLTAGGVYSETFTAANGCDSTVTLTLTVNPAVTSSISATVCANELPFAFGAQSLTAGGVYNQTFTAANGCDSTVTLTLTVQPVPAVNSLSLALCAEDATGYNLTGLQSQIAPGGGSFAWSVQGSLPADLFFSEYVEGSGFNKYLEIFNGTGAPVDLSNYQIRLYSNGALTSTNTALSGTLNNGQVIVLRNSQATAFAGTSVANASVNFNGDDAVGLFSISKNQNVDIIGHIGEDPGVAWTGGGNTTLDRSIRRNANVIAGVSPSAAGFPTLATEWSVSAAIDDVSTLGTHSITGGSTPVSNPASENIANGSVYVATVTSGVCEVSATVTFTVSPAIATAASVSVCADEVPYLFGTQSLTASGTYTEVFTAASGCDSTVTLTFTVKPNVTATASAFICQGQTFVFGSQTLTASGTYTEVFTAANGCDSTVTLTLNVGSQIVNNIAETICAGETFAFNGQNLTTGGLYTATLTSAAGCDSIVNLNLTVNPVFSTTDAVAVCANELPYLFGSQSLTTGGVYTEVFTAANGCDSTVTLTLTVSPVFNVAVSQTIPAGTSLVFGTQTLTATGVYTETFQSAAGCDSVVTLTLTVAGTVDPAVVSALQNVINAGTPASGGITASVLRSDGSIATVFNGFAGIGTPVTEDIKFGTADISQHLLAVLTLRLAEEGILNLADQLGAIPGATAAQVPATVTIEQALRHTSGIGSFAANPAYFSNALSPLFGNLTFDYGTVEYAPIFAFAGNAAAPGTFAYANTNFLALGQKLEALTGQSLQSLLNTYVLAPAGISGIEFFGVPVPAPVSQFYFNLSGLGEQALADQTSVLTSTGGSGSAVATPEAMAEYLRALFGGLILDPASLAQLTSFSPVTGRLGNQYGLGTEEFTLNIEGTDYTFFGHTGDVNYASALIYSPVLNEGAFVSANSSQVTEAAVLEIARQLIRVSLNPAACPVIPVQTVVNAAICAGDSIAFGGQFISAAGMYTDTLQTAAGCDSVVTLKLTVLPAPPVSSITVTLCADEAASVDLTVYEDLINTFVGQFEYTGIANPQNTAVTDGQVVEVIYTSSANGCSAAAAITFNVSPVFNTTAAAAVCANELPFAFGAQSLTAGGVYTEVFTAANGCDSTVTLTLTVNPVFNTTAAETITQGQTFIFGTQVLTVAGVYTEVFTASNGCDSTVTLTLTVLPATGIAAPTNLVADNGTAFLVPLSWNDNSNNETGFRIYRLGVLIATVGANVTTFSDTVTIFGTPVTYFVEAFNATDVSSPSNTATYQMPAQFLQLDLTYVCYNPATDSLTWNVFNPNAQAHPYIFAQWWSPQRDSLIAWVGNSQFKTKRNAQSALTFGNDNITGIYYPIQNFQSLSDLVFTIPLNLTCSGIRQGYVPASGQGGKIFSGVLGSNMNTEANPNELLASVLQVSPNPFRSNVVLESEIPFEGRVRVFNAMGQLVKTANVDLSAPVSVDLSDLAYGVYQLEVTSGNAAHVVKIVKQ